MACEEDRHRENMIGELVQVRDGQLHLPVLPCEVRALIKLGFKVHTRAGTLAGSHQQRPSSGSREEISLHVYVTLAVAGLGDIFNKVAVA